MTDHSTPLHTLPCTPRMAKTTHTTFHPCNAARQPLFAVQAGVPVADALDSVYCLLDVTESLAVRLNEPGAPDREQVGQACAYLVEMAKATVRSCIEGLEQDARQLSV
ncbi:DUF3077 domain-containing protein [Pseudomonas sp.]|uniref:DUF3077 domain-containing protein n=1 Tax=Pseudomonas sp. TaxID=306 RepID=UPI003D0EA1B8